MKTRAWRSLVGTAALLFVVSACDMDVDENFDGGAGDTAADTGGNDGTGPGDTIDPPDGTGPTDTVTDPDTTASCPSDYMTADGTPCAIEGQVCGGDCTDPCQFCNTLTCEGGRWVWMEAFPDPNCECPADPAAAEGAACGVDGQLCGDCLDPCESCRQWLCSGGVWIGITTPGDPNCGGECPTDPMAASGSPCLNEGQVCGDCSDPCTYCSLLTCQDGFWAWAEAIPGPECEECPGDYMAADRTPCVTDGQVCAECSDPCLGCAYLTCQDGLWAYTEAVPSPECDECPADHWAASGSPCLNEGQVCGDCSDPCTYCSLLTCQNGFWAWTEAIPGPECDECPADFMEADGTPCSVEGQRCGGECSDPCQFCNVLFCEAGTWHWLEAFPDPACECPADIMAAVGEACVVEGQVCGDCPDHCQFCAQIFCFDGLWSWREIAPDPACDCPAEPPIGLACEGMQHCEYGEECCCGQCYPSIVCECMGGGQWGCYATDACMIPECPPPDGMCHNGDDCQNGAYCAEPGSYRPCGICFEEPDQCASDEDCTDGEVPLVCEYVFEGCVCAPYRACIPACLSPADCDAGETCTDGHCGPIPCETGGDCPALFACVGDFAPATCTRMLCTYDVDCGGGICVNGQCFDTYGTCEYAVP